MFSLAFLVLSLICHIKHTAPPSDSTSIAHSNIIHILYNSEGATIEGVTTKRNSYLENC